MKLFLQGHDYRYAAEQILLTMFPNERPEYPQGNPPEQGDWAHLKLSFGHKMAYAVCRLSRGGKLYRASSGVSLDKLGDELVKSRLLQRCIKLAFYRSAKAALGVKPAWGALTGIRPVKIMSAYLESGISERAAVSSFCRQYDVSAQKAELALLAARAGLELKRTLEKNDICLYVGIPFCPTRCSYCSFISSSVKKSMALVEPYLDALEREIEAAAITVRRLGLRVRALYMGGGTPTVLSEERLSRLIKILSEQFELKDTDEFTVEAGRPDTITPGKLRLLSRAGVNRLSINPQTMEDAVLESIGRQHTALQVYEAVSAARAAGSFVLNMDIIAGLPGDSIRGFERTLGAVLPLEPENITVHTLSKKKGSRITDDLTPVPDGAVVGAMLSEASGVLSARGYIPYYIYRQKFTSGGFENTGWCKKGFSNLYNISIMEEYCSIISLGGAASTKLVTGTGRIERIFNPKYPLEYIGSIERVIKDKEKIEVFYNGIRAKDD